MKLRKFYGFDKNKNLPPGVYNMTLSEVEELFSKNKSEMRNNILTEYKKHLKEIKIWVTVLNIGLMVVLLL